MKSKSGFTIVELLIVIVVIAILATISIVAYNGIQQRASNTKTIAAVNQVIKSVSGYIAANDAYPYPSAASICIVPADDGTCTIYDTTQRSSNSTLISNLTSISTLPSATPSAHASFNGITYNYSTGRTFNGDPRPLTIVYSLRGEQQKCGVANVTNNGGSTMLSSGSGYTGGNGTGYTYCFISIAGPSS